MSEVEKEVKPEEKTTLKDYLQKLPGAPTDEEIEAWKAKYGEVFMSGFSEVEILVFRPLRRSEHRNLQIQLSKQTEEHPIDELAYQEMVCSTCVLWPVQVDWEAKGGLATSLSEQIFQNSYFLAPQAASLLVVKL
jgi:hypothetical protein